MMHGREGPEIRVAINPTSQTCALRSRSTLALGSHAGLPRRLVHACRFKSVE